MDLSVPSFQYDPFATGSSGYSARPTYRLPGLQEWEGMSVRQRIMVFKHITQSNDQAQENDNAMEQAAKFMLQEQEHAADARDRIQKAYAILGEAGPDEVEPSLQNSDALGALLGGLITGDWNGINRITMDQIEKRAAKQTAKQQREFEARQRGAELDARMASSDLDRAERGEEFWRGQGQRRQELLEERDIRAVELKAAERERSLARMQGDLESATNRLRMADNPSKVAVMAGEVNRLREQLGMPPLSTEDVSALAADAGDRHRQNGWVRYQALANEHAQLSMNYGGPVPQAHLDRLNATVQGLEDEYGVKFQRFANDSTPTLRKSDTDADNQRADDAEERQQKESNARIAKWNADIKRDNKKLALDLEKWQKGEGGAPAKSDFDKQIAKLRQEQSTIRTTWRIERGKISKMPTAGARTPAQNKEFNEAQAAIAKADRRNAEIEDLIKYLAGERRIAVGSLEPAVPVIQGPIAMPPAKRAPNPAPKPPTKPRGKTTPGGNTYSRE